MQNNRIAQPARSLQHRSIKYWMHGEYSMASMQFNAMQVFKNNNNNISGLVYRSADDGDRVLDSR